MDHQFSYDYVPNGYAALTQRMAVLYPLTKPADSVPDIVLLTIAVVAQWRARLLALADLGWQPRDSERGLADARNCPPPFAKPHGPSRFCHQQRLCPFCYARQVRETYARFERFLHGEESAPIWAQDGRLEELPADQGPVCRWHLVERRRWTLIPYQPAKDDGLQPAERLHKVFDRALTLRREFVSTLQPIGAYYQTTVEACHRGWIVRNRQLAVIDAEQDVPDQYLPGGQVVLRRHSLPTRRVLAHAVARTCRYPRLLLRASPAETVLLLREQATRRLSAFYGDV